MTIELWPAKASDEIHNHLLLVHPGSMLHGAETLTSIILLCLFIPPVLTTNRVVFQHALSRPVSDPSYLLAIVHGVLARGRPCL